MSNQAHLRCLEQLYLMCDLLIVHCFEKLLDTKVQDCPYFYNIICETNSSYAHVKVLYSTIKSQRLGQEVFVWSCSKRFCSGLHV